MPFTKNGKRINKRMHNNRVSLQVQRSIKAAEANNRRRRVFLSASHRGSITLEAALVVPLFLFAIVTILYFMVIINIHLNIQVAIEEIADDLMTRMYAVENIESDENEILEKGAAAVWMYAQLVNKIGSDNLDNTYIVNGAAGLNLLNSKLDTDTGLGDIVVTYSVRIPFMPEAVRTLNFTQRCRFRFWTGSSLQSGGDKDIVYITMTGTVYHRDLTCYHLNLSVSKTTYAQMLDMRNENGAKYSACSYCITNDLSASSVVYITTDGTKYHSSLGCSALKRGIITVDISEVGDMPACSNCGGSMKE